MIDLEQAQKEFLKYVNQFDIKEKRIKRKIEHSLRVMEISKQIAQNLNWNKEEIELATLIGLLHDIGRFEQYTKYKTFNDKNSIDHGTLGAHILLENNKIRSFIQSQKYDEIIKKSIYNHNKYSFENNLTEQEKKFCALIKDCDKLDILYEACEIFWKNDKERIEKSEISKVVLQDFFQEKLIENNLKVTQLDHVIGMISFIYDINFKESYEFLIKKDYINKLIKRFDFKIEKQNMKEIQLYANEYVKKKIKDDRIE